MRRVLLPSFLIYLLIFSGLATLTGELLVLALPLIALIGGSLLFSPEKLDLKVERQLSNERNRPSAPIEVTLTVTNQGGLLEELHITEALPAGLRLLDGETALVVRLGVGESLTLKYRLEGNRGYFQFPPVEFLARDLFDSFRRRDSIRAEGENQVYILPDVQRLRRIPIRPRGTRVYAGSIPARVGGSGSEFFGVRAYELGDSLRHINWRANARHRGMLFTNEFQQERIADVGVILDARTRTDQLVGGHHLFEHGVMAAAALVDIFLTEGNRVGLLQYGRFLDWTTPGYGKHQRERVLRALARARPGTSEVFEGLQHLPTRFFPPKSQIILISPLCEADPPYLIQLRGRGYELLVISPNPVRFEFAGIAETPAARAALRVAAIERGLLIKKLRGSGIRLVDWDVTRPLAGTVNASLARQPLYTGSRGII